MIWIILQLLLLDLGRIHAQNDCYKWVGEGEMCEGVTGNKCKYGLTCVNHDADALTPRVCLGRGSEGDICAGGVLQPFEGCLGGLYCAEDEFESSVYRCKVEGKEGDLCSSDDACVTGYGCNFAPPRESGKLGLCTKMGSLGDGIASSNQDLCRYGLLLFRDNQLGYSFCKNPTSISCQVKTDCISSSKVFSSDLFCCSGGVCDFEGPTSCAKKYDKIWEYRRGQRRNQFGAKTIYDADDLTCDFTRCLVEAGKSAIEHYPCNSSPLLRPSSLLLILTLILLGWMGTFL